MAVLRVTPLPNVSAVSVVGVFSIVNVMPAVHIPITAAMVIVLLFPLGLRKQYRKQFLCLWTL